jgi:aspartyl-tRNA(Asn)/glutamyl-tRNA(Gln) amidotransferase subunit A
MAGPDARDWQALPADGTDYRIGLEAGVMGLRIALSPSLGYARVQPEVRAAVERAAAALQSLGAHIEPADPGFASPHDMFERIWFAGAALLVDGIAKARRKLLDPGLRRVAAAGARLRALELQRAAKARAELAIGIERFLFERFDLLLTPTLPITAFPVGREVPEPDAGGEWVDWTPFSYPFNLGQQPAISVPCGLAGGLPVGLQIVGPKYADALVLRAARAVESALPFAMPRPEAGAGTA